jgi:hypothetical protein
MAGKVPTAFIIFIIALLLSTAIIIAAIFFNVFQWGTHQLIYLGLAQSVVAILTPFGIYIAYKDRSNVSKYRGMNRFALWGNAVLLLYTIYLIIFAVV